MTNEASLQLVEDAKLIVRYLYVKRLEGTLEPMDEAVRRILDLCLRRGIQCGDGSAEEQEFAASVGISA